MEGIIMIIFLVIPFLLFVALIIALIRYLWKKGSK